MCVAVLSGSVRRKDLVESVGERREIICRKRDVRIYEKTKSGASFERKRPSGLTRRHREQQSQTRYYRAHHPS